MKIRPWPFGNNIVHLHWVGNVKLRNKQWYIQVAFAYNSDCTILDLPIGVLPMLRIGVPYKDGLPLITQKTGTYYYVTLEDLSIGSTVKAIDVCRKFNIFLYKRPELMNQNMWTFHSNGLTYFISHLELIRALFTPNKTLANAILRPNALNLLVTQSYYTNNGQTVFLDFDDTIPGSIMNGDFVRFFGWLYFDNDIKKSFESIQSNAYSYRIKNKNQYSIPLEISVPSTGQINMSVRGIEKNNEVFILEIQGTDIADPPFYEIQYRHKSNKKYVYSKDPKKKRISKQEKKSDLVLNEKNGERSKEDTHQPVIDLDPTQIAFRHSTVVTRISKSEQKVNQGDEYISNKGRGGGIKHQIVGLDESIYGGEIVPIEFNSLEISDSILNYGLDNFITMVRYLSKQYPQLIISINVVFLPAGRKFSFLPDGRKRICVIVKVVINNNAFYILEVAVPDNYSLSTLIVPLINNQGENERLIQSLLKNLVLNNGNWSKSFLKKINHSKIRHSYENYKLWGKRIIREFRF
ncbi:Tn7-like element transposition protein TnsE [Schinkia azotoformans]|uniref:Tn7-like element transposition protein TnsE n=1 Tax=Schinkia azotoformans TaxID=1454 RepID=UPI000A4CF1C7|nr:Tn7-like element transposition protein TnsE [Schinkia azotoformans]MEC1698149.1 Tn7-like element transposition protein TnsE [Schinkia azotoformans]MEC1714796.1 Tn7-like element transposition protein TnsE [Schinkia azotoformans]MEC1727097.1 Tn7-like element transposition protein TnsE [Schinkia azotoformans]MEC1742288.1 Tn7-like element transposition protein TnsE [Schinkia azotoformans]MEC1757448.1 Tn7-like element transposition protein TnsE [Schinkia azotoformans]